MAKKKYTQWHPAFFGAMRLEFAENKNDLEYFEEIILNTMPLKIDFLVIKKDTYCQVKNEIGRFFRKYNIIEYKSPDDTLNYNTFLMGMVYACLYKIKETHIDDVPLEEITISFIRRRKPVKLLNILRKKKFLIEEKLRGIYYISKEGFFPMQIVVGKELNFEYHMWLNSLTRGLTSENVKKLIQVTNQLTEKDDKDSADSVWEVVATENRELVKTLREGNEMCKALAEIMKPEIDAAVEAAVEAAVKKASGKAELVGADKKGMQVFKNMINRGFSQEEAQALAEISDELVQQALQEM